MSSLPADLVTRHIDGVTVIRLRLSNVTSAADITRLTATIKEMIDSGSTRVVLDLKHVRYVGSATLGMLLALHQSISDKGGKLVLSRYEPVAQLLRISKTGRLFMLAPDPKSAVALIKPSN